MIAVITYIKLKNPLKYFQLIGHSIQIMKQLQQSSGLSGQKNTGIWTKHYTITMWENEEVMKAFAHSGPHLEAMKKSKEIASEIRTHVVEVQEMPTWKDAKKQLMTDGKVLTF